MSGAIVLALLLAQGADAGTARNQAWRGDLRTLATELPKRHKNLFFKVPRETFTREVEALDAAIPGMQDFEIKVAFLRLISGMGDSHTAVGWKREDFSTFPLRVYRFREGWFVLAASEEYESALGARLVGIGDLEIEQAASRIRRLVPCENESCYLARLPDFLLVPEFLRAEKVLSDVQQARLVLESTDRGTWELEVKATPPEGQAKLAWATLTVPRAEREHALRLDKQSVHYWYEFVPASKTLYVAYNRCRDQDSPSFKEFSKDLLSFLDGHEVDRLVLDLRRNGGGNEGLLRPLIVEIRKRKSINRRGHLFVVIGRGTFSSAAQNAMELKEKTEAVIVGEPTGQKPNHYGEVKELRLPHWGVDVGYSTTYWKRVPGDPEAFVPDLEAPPSFAALMAGKDPAMETILGF